MNAEQVIHHWIKQKLLGTEKYAPVQTRTGNVWFSGDEIYSYGTHFTLARINRDKRGKPVLLLLAGDRSTKTTTGHQAAMRAAASQQDRVPVVVLPFSVLGSAGIEPRTVRLLETTAARWTEHRLVTDNVRREYEYATLPGTECFVREDGSTVTSAWGTPARHWDTEAVVHKNEWRADLPYGHPDKHTSWYEDQDGNRVQWVERRTKNTGRIQFVSGKRTEWTAFDDNGTVRYERIVRRHWLGEALVTGEVTSWRRVRCDECKGTGEVEPFEVPVPSWLLRRDPTQKPTISAHCAKCDGRGMVSRTSRTRRRFLSGYDANETRQSYFFCELPSTSRAKTVAEAYEDLKPPVVRLAEEMGREVRRQGDIFTVPLNVTTRDLRKQGASITKAEFILGTNHRATEVATVGKATYVRGTLTHDPGEFRRPDHARVSVGKQWALAVKNTVPVSA